jgi:hypothetical protein
VNQPPSVAALYEQMEHVRRAGPPVTNFYPSPDKLQRSIEHRTLYSVSIGNVLFILRRDRDFFHMSYVASRDADLASALGDLVGTIGEAMTVDVLGKREHVDDMAGVFGQVGFKSHRTLVRMTAKGPMEQPVLQPEVELALSADGPALAHMLDVALDRFAEQIPDTSEMAAAAADNKVLLVRSGSTIAGLLYFEVTGQSSLLRHWLVDLAYREQRVGARLMRRYFAECTNVRRFLLWVISDNHNAIDRYRHYGYEQDGLVDQVLIRRPS